ncbi:MAG: hypothetical protein EBR82_40905 [Caulobacteraceae bacterium]|nr:hypothetical protein [Caulobacteraceae bacterium]
MATNFDKTKIFTEEEDFEPIEIEIEDPESVSIGIGDTELVFDNEEDEDFGVNLAEYLDEGYLESLASELIGEYNDDLNSRKDWETTIQEGMDLLGLRLEERAEPWEGACGITHPMVSEAVVRYQAEMIMETVPAQGPVKTQVIGKETKEKLDAAERVSNDMNYRLMNQMVEWRSEQERLYWSQCLMGSAFKKVYYDPNLGRQVSAFVPADDLIVNYGATSLETSERITHRMRKGKNDIRKLQVAGFYRDVDLGDPPRDVNNLQKKRNELEGVDAVNDTRYRLLEIHTYLDLEGYEDEKDGEPTGIALPYVVTINESNQQVLAVRRNWKEDDELHQARAHFVHYPYITGFGFYGFGLLHLIGGHARGATSLLRQLVDAGTLSNLPGGLKARGLRIIGDDTPIAPGEFRDVDVPGGSIRDNILPLPYKEPSQTLAQLLNVIVEEGRRFASISDMKVSDMSSQAPVGTTLAILERTLKVMSAVQARVHYSLKQEFKLLAQIIRDYTSDEYSYDVDGEPRYVKQSDYDQTDIIPVSDPNAATMSQRIVQYQAALQLAATAPQIYDLPNLHKQMLNTLGIKNVDKLVPTTDDMKPKDPVSENMAFMILKPTKAFAYQDHEAHLQTHMSFIQDPKLQQTAGQSPMFQQVMAAAQAHIAEHIGFIYRRQIEEMIGAPLPDPDEPLPEDIEYQMSSVIAMAAQKLLQKDISEVQQQQNQQAMQDPIIQQSMKELQIKETEVQAKMQRDQAEIALKAEEIRLRDERERERIASQERIAGANVGAKAANAVINNASKEQIAGAKIGVDAAKNRVR